MAWGRRKTVDGVRIGKQDDKEVTYMCQKEAEDGSREANG